MHNYISLNKIANVIFIENEVLTSDFENDLFYFLSSVSFIFLGFQEIISPFFFFLFLINLQ